MEYIYKCSKCEGLNISLDIETGQTVCLDCKNNDKVKKLDIEEYRMKNVEAEENNINNLKMQGTDVNIDTKKNRITNEDYNILGPT